MSFVHLHYHTMYSPLDGMGRPEEIMSKCKELGQPAVAITDHGSTSGLYDCIKAGEKYSIKVILGTEFYVNIDGHIGHLVILAKNNDGLKNIFKLQEYAYVEGFYMKPLIDMEILENYSDNLICSSACLANVIPQCIMNNKSREAIRWALEFKRIFGNDFYLEIQPNEIPEQILVNKAIQKISMEYNIPTIVTNDVHYVYKEDAYVHEVLLAMQFNKKMDDEKRFKFPTYDFYHKSEEEIREQLKYLRDDFIDNAINNTGIIADMCNATITRENHLPKFTEDKNEDEILRELVYSRFKPTIIDKGINVPGYLKEVDRELQIIARNGYSGYFLIVQEYVNWARQNNIIVGDGRGSGSGSKVGYILGIHKINPAEHNLLFERFMSDGREPDIDVDFSDIDKMFTHLQQVYGEENVARIVAFGTLAPKAVVRKIFSTFGYPMSLISKINGCMPNRPKFTLEEAYNESTKLQQYRKEYEKEFKIIDRLEGIVSHESQHAGGVIICENLSEHLPIKTIAEDRSKRIVAFDKYMLEELGHFKFDILGLKTLELIYEIVSMVKKEQSDFDLHEINYEDESVYKMLCDGHLTGVFQLSDQSNKVIQQQPNNFADLIAINALIRPGVGDWEEYISRRKGKKWSVNEKRLSYMQDTEGIITYQEQFLLDCKTFAGWDIAFADKYVRKNKNINEDTELAKKFIDDSVNNQNNPDEMNKLWEEICQCVSTGYNFNKSHATSYAMMTYQTAYLKYYYPEYFYAGLMTLDKLNQTVLEGLISECKNYGIQIIPPNINTSIDKFSVFDKKINYCIASITGVGENCYSHIASLRPIKSLEDLLTRGKKTYIRKNVALNLIKSGCFDFENENRVELIEQLIKIRNIKDIENNKKWNDKTKTIFEKESLGLYLTKHPLEEYSFKSIKDYPDNCECLIAGEVVDLTPIYDKNGNQMAFMTLSSQYGNTKCIIFHNTWNNKKLDFKSINISDVIMIKGIVSGPDCITNSYEKL